MYQPQVFEPQVFEPAGAEPRVTAPETFATVPYPPVQGRPGCQPEAFGGYAASRDYGAPHATPVNWAPASRERNWMAVISIVLACLGGGFVGFLFGWFGRVAAREGRATNGRLARTGMILNGVVPFVLTGVALAYINLASGGSSGQSSWADGAVGDCVAESQGVGANGAAWEPKTVACEGTHWAQVYFTATVAEGPYPGEPALANVGKEACVSAKALGRVDRAHIADMFPIVIVPTEESWAAKDRTIICLASDVDNSIVGSWVTGS